MPVSIPPDLISSLQGIPGFDETAFVEAHTSGEKITSVRFNPHKFSALQSSGGTACVPFSTGDGVPWCPHGVYLEARPSFTFDPLFHAGLYYVQEASSMFLWEVLRQTIGDKTNGLKVLDLCAAPGGKSTLLASYFQNGLLVANEVIKSRANILAENIAKWGYPNTVVTNNDPKDFKRLPNYFDVMVVDAPCSGSGLFRKDAAAINEWSQDAVQLCSLRQHRILSDAYDSLKEGGLLVYATCSYSPQEDEAVLEWAMDNFALSPIALDLPSQWNVVPTASPGRGAAGYRFYPYKLRGEGFFIAVFRKTDGASGFVPGEKLPPLNKNEADSWRPWLQEPDNMQLFKQKENTLAIPMQWAHDISFLQQHLYLKSAGTVLGTIKGKDVIPHHALAVSIILHRQVPGLTLDLEQAVQYLQKKEMNRDTAGIQKGWQLASCCGLPLGWLKVLPNRVNNYYPLEWRILKN